MAEAVKKPRGWKYVMLRVTCPAGHVKRMTSTSSWFFGSAADYCHRCDAVIVKREYLHPTGQWRPVQED